MLQRSNEVARQMPGVLVETFTVNHAINHVILEHLDPKAWRAKPPGRNARTIAAIFAHVHNICRKWLRLSAPHLKLQAPARSFPLHAMPCQRCLGRKREALAGRNGHSPSSKSARRLGQASVYWSFEGAGDFAASEHRSSGGLDAAHGDSELAVLLA